LRKLLRSPIGFAWEYALGWREPDSGAEAMELDPMEFGALVHRLLETALPQIEAAGGLSHIAPGQIAAIVQAARVAVAAQWEATSAVPPTLLWHVTLERAERMAITALTLPMPDMAVGRSYAEVPFGADEATVRDLPWDSSAAVTIPGTDLRIRGFIDRLDLTPDGRRARVVDYKTGRPSDPGMLNGGQELQRCLYAAAVRAMLGETVEVEAALLFPLGDGAYYPLADSASALDRLTTALLIARDTLLKGRALPGPDTGLKYDAMAFAMPASPGAMTERKRAAAAALLGDAALIWEQA
jgi:RecB family exonuclease